jgi:hypothetical protein
MAELEVSPESLVAAADLIVRALATADVSTPPVPTGGPAYGHDVLATTVAELGAALRSTSALLLGGARRTAAGLRAGAHSYTTREQANFAALTGLYPR